MSHIVLAKAWNNGKFLPNGGGYGIRLTNYFKDEYLDINWVSITLELEGWEKQVELAINTDAFWSHGRELRSGVIGKWLIANGKASWTGAGNLSASAGRQTLRRFSSCRSAHRQRGCHSGSHTAAG